MRARLRVALVSGVLVAGLVLASVALGVHSMTSPSVAGPYSATNPSGAVKFYFSERETKRRIAVITISEFGFHDACTTAFTKVRATMRVNDRRYRFRYTAHAVAIGGETSHVTIAGRLFFNQHSNFPLIKGAVTIGDSDCPADPNGVITFKTAGLEPPSAGAHGMTG